MKRKSLALTILSWIHDLLLFEGIYVLAAAVQKARGRELYILLFNGLLMLLPVILSYLVILRCQNLWIFLAISLAAAWGMKVLTQNLLTGCLSACVFLFRCYVKLRQGEIRRKMKELPNEAGAGEDQELWEIPTLLDSPRIIHCLLFAAMYFGVLYFHRYGLLNLMLGILAAELCICLACRYLERLDGFIKQNISVANLPASTMKKIGTGILLIGVLGLIIFMLPAAIYHKEPLSNLRFDPFDTGNEHIEYFEENAGTDPLLEELMRLKAQAKDPPKWLRNISEILSVLTLLLMIFLAFRLILKAVRKAMESFLDDDDEIIFLEKEADSQEQRRNPLRRRESESFRSPNRRIRRVYKRLIRHHLGENPYGYETPLELEEKAGLYEKDDETMKEIHALYEKARYGNEDCTKEEARECVRISSKL